MPKYDKLKFKVDKYDGEQYGSFIWGKGRDKVFDQFYNAIEISDPDKYLSELDTIIKEDPEFIDAYNSIGWFEIDIKNYGSAFAVFSEAYEIGRKLIPSDFKGKILWAELDNRPFLRTMHGLGLTYLFLQEWERASDIFVKLLNYNPNDNQGVRAMAIHSYLAQGKFKKVLSICKNFPEDVLPDTLYGVVLANYRLDKIQQAEKALKDAIKFSPKVARELTKKSHKKPKSVLPDSLSIGGDDEAYDYWERLGLFWTDPKLINFIEDGLKKWGK